MADPTDEELSAIEAEKAEEAMHRQLPADPPAGFDMGMGHATAPDDMRYGRLKVVGWLPRREYERHGAEEAFLRRGVRFETLFYTARFWCAGVYE